MKPIADIKVTHRSPKTNGRYLVDVELHGEGEVATRYSMRSKQDVYEVVRKTERLLVRLGYEVTIIYDYPELWVS